MIFLLKVCVPMVLLICLNNVNCTQWEFEQETEAEGMSHKPEATARQEVREMGKDVQEIVIRDPNRPPCGLVSMRCRRRRRSSMMKKRTENTLKQLEAGFDLTPNRERALPHHNPNNDVHLPQDDAPSSKMNQEITESLSSELQNFIHRESMPRVQPEYVLQEPVQNPFLEPWNNDFEPALEVERDQKKRRSEDEQRTDDKEDKYLLDEVFLP